MGSAAAFGSPPGLCQRYRADVLLAWPTLLTPWDWSSSDWAGLTFVFVAIAALVAAWQAREARRLRVEQARPFVIMDLDVQGPIIDLRIKNIGKTLARDVRFEFRPPQFASTFDGTPGRESGLKGLNVFKEGIPTLAPNTEIKFFFDLYPERLEARLPMKYEVTISYNGTGRKRHSDKTVLDVNTFLGTGGVTRHGLHDIHERLKEIGATLKKS